jgi:hypothetical protein
MVILCAWVPAIAVVAFAFPRFAPVFDRLNERHQLPAVTEYAMLFTRFGPVGSIVVGLVTVALLVAVDVVAKKARLRAGARAAWLWLAVLSGGIAFLAGVLALLLPVFTFSASVE